MKWFEVEVEFEWELEDAWRAERWRRVDKARAWRDALGRAPSTFSTDIPKCPSLPHVKHGFDFPPLPFPPLSPSFLSGQLAERWPSLPQV